jgi:MFS family permease
MVNTPRRSGVRTFLLIWFGQLVSLLGTGMTRFALLLWAYQQTAPTGHPATTVALLGFCAYIPYLLCSPLAGVVVDRVDRRRVMLCADLGAGALTLGMWVCYTFGDLRLWHLYLAEALTGACEAFQVPAYTAATSLLVDKASYGRVNGLRALADAASQVLAPVLAGALLPWIALPGIMLIDVATAGVACLTLLTVHIPPPPVALDDGQPTDGWWHHLSYGFRYIRRHPGLQGLLCIYVGINGCAALTYFSILPTMVLARSGNNASALATVHMALGLGGVAGGLLASVWRGPQRRIHTVLLGAALSFLVGDVLFAVGREVIVWTLAALCGSFFIPLIMSANRAIWQTHVPPAVQGRVFAVQSMLQQLSMPVGYVVAGPLADSIFEPAMQPGSSLSAVLGGLVGTGPGAGMAVMFLGTALLGTMMSLSGYLIRAVRCIEDEASEGSMRGKSREESPATTTVMGLDSPLEV